LELVVFLPYLTENLRVQHEPAPFKPLFWYIELDGPRDDLDAKEEKISVAEKNENQATFPEA
jgi:hypothetical protein